ncbi:MAG: NYN domain-containing protein [Myxococcales bacterium]|nr:NYN domain-containing protein [Myxococcales bacterium]MCB9550982.1 NYN domain-containing protein [Myxococcales bacterium]
MNDRIDREANLALFCDFENVAIGAREARYETFDISLVLERLLDKGKIVVKKAYADWGRYKAMRRPLHEASFELIEIPHVSYSGKNSADIRLVVDALDLCYTKGHVDVFVIISGDSDFSPLAAKLRENAKRVIGVGVKNSSADMLMESCDEFIYYDDLVRDKRAAERKQRPRVPESPAKPETREAAPPSAATPSATTPSASSDDGGRDEKKNKEEALELVLETVDALFRDRDDSLWGSMVKQTIKRKRPQFNETFHGYRNFNQLLEDARDRGLLEIEKDRKSGGYLITAFGPKA